MTPQASFDLAGFDAEAAQLDLVVHPSDELELTVREPADKVARAVHAAARRTEGIVDEALRRQLGLAEIATRQAMPGKVEFPDGTDRQQLALGVQDIDLGVA